MHYLLQELEERIWFDIRNWDFTSLRYRTIEHCLEDNAARTQNRPVGTLYPGFYTNLKGYIGIVPCNQ